MRTLRLIKGSIYVFEDEKCLGLVEDVGTQQEKELAHILASGG